MRRQYLWYSLIFISILIIFGALYGIFSLKKIIVSPIAPTPLPTSILPTPTSDPDAEFSVLLLGYGGGLHDGGALTDSIILANIRPHDRKISLISIPRDLWVELPVGTSTPYFSKLNSAYPYGNDDKKFPDKLPQFTGPAGGGQMVSSVVSQVTGKTVNYFLAVDFAGFTKAVDVLGGIDLRITQPFTDKFYPLEIGTTDTCGKSGEEIIALEATMSGDKLDQQFTCRYETLAFSVGTTHLDGATALKFARSRHSEFDGGDFNRSSRQRQVILAIKSRVINFNFISKIIPLLRTLSSHLRTNIPLSTMESHLSRASEFSQYQVTSVSLNDKNVLLQSFQNRQSVLIPTGGVNNYSEIIQYILDQQTTNSKF
ncbi:MAG: LCP family protein [Microgenomates group bacterium]